MDNNNEFDYTDDVQAGHIAANIIDKSNITKKSSKENSKHDPYDIGVEITGKAPVVVLFGGYQSGKTMILVRLARYLRKNGYSVKPNGSFRDSTDTNYEEMCRLFESSVYSEYAAEATSVLNFMLLDVFEGGGGPLICRILEAPGEDYFHPNNPDRQWKTYIDYIRDNENFHKVWIFIVEIDWKLETSDLKDGQLREKYAAKIAKMRNEIKDKDRIILMCNKMDGRHKDVFYHKGYPNKREVYGKIKEQYSAIFESNKNTNPIKRFLSPYNIDFIAFSSGEFYNTGGRKRYKASEDFYPRNLWRTIYRNVKGRWF